MEYGTDIRRESQQHCGYSSLPHQPPGIMVHDPHQMTSIKASSAPSDASSLTASQKRGRGDHDEVAGSGQHSGPLENPPSFYEETPVICVSSQKKARSSNYVPPRAVKKSILTAMGTLATTNGPPGAISGGSVPLRRRLSGGHLEEFMGTHDQNMEMDTADSRPRSMSF
jgi:hypothetical protein